MLPLPVLEIGFGNNFCMSVLDRSFDNQIKFVD